MGLKATFGPVFRLGWQEDTPLFPQPQSGHGIRSRNTNRPMLLGMEAFWNYIEQMNELVRGEL